MAQIKGFYNEKGNVSAKVRNSIKDQAIARVLYALQNDEMLAGSVKNADGGISVPVCTNERGETVYALMAITISTCSLSCSSIRSLLSGRKPGSTRDA